jgi:polysaccharide lyase family 4-like protein
MLRALLVLLLLEGAGRAGTLVGKLELPAAPERPAAATKGFLERVENPLAPVQPLNVPRQIVIVVEGDEKPATPPQVTWDLVGNSFARPVIAAPAGAEVVIKNLSKTAHTLVAKEDPKLVPPGPINPTGPKSFRATDPGKVYTLSDPDAPYLVGKLIVVNTQFIAYPDDSGKFEITDIPPGAYKVKIWYRDGWLERPEDSVEVNAKGKTELNPKITALAPPAAKK